MFGKKEKRDTGLNKNTKCSQCGRLIKQKQNYTVIKNKVYCEKCARKKKDWDFMFFMDLMEDD